MNKCCYMLMKMEQIYENSGIDGKNRDATIKNTKLIQNKQGENQ